MGGWASAKLLLDLYGHFLPTESTGFADAIGVPKRPYTAPKQRAVAASSRVHLALGTNIKWLQNMGGWASAKLLLDLYGQGEIE